MPELPEVETVVKALGRALAGRTFSGARLLGAMRRSFDPRRVARRLAGRTVTGVRRRAKYIVVDLDAPLALLAHLGMTGFFHLEPAGSELLKHDRAVFPLDGGEELRYSDARRFGFVDLVALAEPGEWPAELAGLGLEPLGRGFGAAVMAARSRGRKCPVKNFIMDQAVVVGVGNIYASEALHLAGIDPRRAAGNLSSDEWERLVKAVKSVLRRAVRAGGSTIRNYRTVDGGEGGFQRALHVYGRKGDVCAVCGAEVSMIRQGGRSTFFCPGCQR